LITSDFIPIGSIFEKVDTLDTMRFTKWFFRLYHEHAECVKMKTEV